MAKLNMAAVGTAGLAGVLLLSIGGAVVSQEATPPGTPPPWATLVRCAGMPSDDARLSCYDDAMRAAGYAPKPEAVVAERHKHFGLSLPQIGGHKRHPQEEGAASAPAPSTAVQEDEDHIAVTLDKVALMGNGRLLMITVDGGIWEQTDDVPVAPLPKSGEEMQIHRGKLGGYFCDVNKYKSVRCTRDK